MESDRLKWNSRFESEDSYLGQRPSTFLQQEIERIKQLAPGKRAVDVACGEGRNSLYLAQQGFCVTALDISDVGLAKGRRRAIESGVTIEFHQVDLDHYIFDRTYDLIINFNFLLRNLIPGQVRALAPGGLLLFDTIRQSEALLAAHNPAYLLQQGELRRIFEGFDGEILRSEELCEGEMPTARLLFRKSCP